MKARRRTSVTLQLLWLEYKEQHPDGLQYSQFCELYHKDEDPPVNEFYREGEIRSFFEGFRIEEGVREHHRALPVARRGLKAFLYTYVFKPVYNLVPEGIALDLAYKYSVTATKV
jgi:hypothetical protein